MERKIGEKFIHEGTLLEAVKEKCGCTDCFFNNNPYLCSRNNDITGRCLGGGRSDKTGVIFKKVKEDKTMTKSDLKPGMIVERKAGEKFLVLNENLAVGLSPYYLNFNDYDENLVCRKTENGTIVKVYITDEVKNVGFETMLRQEKNLTLIWERQKEVVLTMEQIAEKFNVDVNHLKIKK